MNKVIALLISTLVFWNIAFSQEVKEIDYKVLKKNYFQYASENMASLNEDQVSKLFRFRLNLKKVKRINNLIDGDIVNIVLNENFNYKSKAVFRPHVIIGTVVNQTYDNREASFFHTEWAVKIDEIVGDDGDIISNSSTNTTVGKEVYIKSMTGKVGNKYRSISHSKNLSIGEKVLLFIAPVRGLGYRRFLNESDMLRQFGISSIDNIDKSFTITGGFTIKSNNVYKTNGMRLGSLKNIKKTTKKIIKINNRLQFEEDFSKE